MESDMIDVDEQAFVEWFDSIQTDLAHALVTVQQNRENRENKRIRLFIDFNLKEYSLYCLGEDFGFHSTETGEMITKDTCTHSSYIRDFNALKLTEGWEFEAAKSLYQWMQFEK